MLTSWQFLMLMMCDGPTRNIRDMAAACLQGEDALFALYDALIDGGFNVQG